MGASLLDLLGETTQTLSAVSESPRFEAELLLAHALGISRSALLTQLRKPADVPTLESLVERRLRHEPIAYILGEWEFYSLPLIVEPPILVPRPETEHLVEAVLGEVGDRTSRIVDLCTGSGCVAVAIAWNASSAQVHASDINPQAVDLAQRNAVLNGVAARMTFHTGDLFSAIPSLEGLFDVVCANPPYVEDGDWSELPPDIRDFEDQRAVLAGRDGLDVVRSLIQDARAHLKIGGLLAFEIGMEQYDASRTLLKEYGYDDVRVRRDLAGLDRIVTARWRQ